ncbi:hypothetical protein RHGRI_010976 [Rhododendron griersonianum]|uniref:Uncharacterized protein n=1 Tax=Rhododendron griersonianum TaxID=479676 RepID=A0AAV6KKR3_9ERIC|nr:hypothetical protein RHGRI_010976 [Rhododendron griersonianum]
MADGTLSMVEGLGLKTLDSNELRRKQVPHMESPNNGIPTRSVQASSPKGFGAHSPKSPKSTSPARKLQQAFQNERRQLESEARMLEIVSHLEDELNNSADPFILDVVTAKLQSVQQTWKEDRQKEAEERATRLNSNRPSSSTASGILGPESQQNPTHPRPQQQTLFEETLILEAEERARLELHQQQQQQEVSSIPVPKTLVNARGTPYLEGDPNMGFDETNTRPRRPWSPNGQPSQTTNKP